MINKSKKRNTKPALIEKRLNATFGSDIAYQEIYKQFLKAVTGKVASITLVN